MRKLGQYSYAAVCIPFLRVLQNPVLAVRGRAMRVVFVLIERSWGTLIPPDHYKGDGRDRRGWQPSEIAVREVRQTKYHHWIIDPLRVKDIAEQLDEDEGNISKELTWLEVMGLLKVEGKRYRLNPTPVLKGSEKVVTHDNFFLEHPLFQQLENLRLQIETELAQAKQAALEPVLQKYQPKLEEVNTQQRKLKRELKRQRKQTTSTPEVVGGNNFQKSTALDSTPTTQKQPARPSGPKKTEVVTHDNFLELSPIRRVVTHDNFQPALNIGSKYNNKDNNNRASGDAPGSSVVVAELLDVLNEYGTTTTPAAKRLLSKCKEAQPDCAASEIIGVIRRIGEGFTQRTKNPVGVLLVQVPEALKTSTRKTAKPATNGHRPPVNDLNDEAARRNALATLNDPRASETDRQMAREILEQQPA